MVMKLLKPICKEEVVKVISENTTSLLGSDRLVVLARWLQCHVHCIPSNKPTQVCPKCYRGMSAVIVVLDRRRDQQTRGGSRKWTWREPIQVVLGTEVPHRGQGAEAQSPGRGSGGWSPPEADDFWQLKGYLDVTSGILGGMALLPLPPKSASATHRYRQNVILMQLDAEKRPVKAWVISTFGSAVNLEFYQGLC